MLSRLNDVSLSVGLPIYYRSDIDIDASVIERYPGDTEFAWLLKEAGTVIMPLRMGVPAYTCLHWVADKDGQQRYFHIKQGKIRSITQAVLERLVNEAPTGYSDDQVNQILSMRHWGTFHPPEFPAERSAWQSWLKWFRRHDHGLMIRYLERAIELNKVAA